MPEPVVDPALASDCADRALAEDTGPPDALAAPDGGRSGRQGKRAAKIAAKAAATAEKTAGKTAAKRAEPEAGTKSDTASAWLSCGPGRLTCSGAPGHQRLAELQAMGATHVVTLLREREPAFNAVPAGCERLGLEWLHVPLSGGRLGDDADPASLARATEVAALLRDGASCVVHCAAGLHRTGAFAYLVLRHCKLSRPEAERGVAAMRAVTGSELVLARKWGRIVDLAEAFLQTGRTPEGRPKPGKGKDDRRDRKAGRTRKEAAWGQD